MKRRRSNSTATAAAAMPVDIMMSHLYFTKQQIEFYEKHTIGPSSFATMVTSYYSYA